MTDTNGSFSFTVDRMEVSIYGIEFEKITDSISALTSVLKKVAGIE